MPFSPGLYSACVGVVDDDELLLELLMDEVVIGFGVETGIFLVHDFFAIIHPMILTVAAPAPIRAITVLVRLVEAQCSGIWALMISVSTHTFVDISFIMNLSIVLYFIR